MADSHSYTFLPWVREGAVCAIEAPDDPNSTLDSRAQMNVIVKVNEVALDQPIKVRLYGPGDVTGFDARQVIRTDPLHLISDFEPNYFPVVEFDRPDFPWMFTPAKANNKEQLRPWICLVVVEKNEHNLKADPTKPLPVLTADPKTELPDISESWAWAHVQVAGELTVDQPLDKVLANRPERTLARLLCPRHLEANKSYYACVVPTFEAGRMAGLGTPIADLDKVDGQGQPIQVDLKPAWDNTTETVELPVYYHWEFSTGAAGDFESLVWLLQRRFLSPEVSPSKMKVIQVAPFWPDAFEVPLEGALRPPEFPQKPIATPRSFKNNLQKLLNAGENQQSPPILPAGLPIPPPIYGRWHAAQKTIPDIPDGKRNAVWLRDLNLNPSHRAVASIGTQIVQDQQEQLMASAWEQVGEIEKANQALRQAQLARSAGTMIHEQHLKEMPAETLIYVTGATHTRVMTGTQTLFAEVRHSVVPHTTVQGPFRRLTRPRGPLARRVAAYGELRTGQLIRRLNDKELKVVPERLAPNGMVTMDKVFEMQHPDNADLQEKFCKITKERLNSMPLPLQYPEMWRAFKNTAIEHQGTMEPCGPKMPPQKLSLDLGQIKTTLLGALDPNVSIVARFKARLVAPPDWKPEDPLEPIMAAPEFPKPMYKPLADLSQSFMLPGLEHVPPNTITLLETNPRFVEAFMVGLNHEMSRELLWREFPTDQRGTYFRQFWDPRGRVPPPATPEEREKLKDIKPIPEWDSGKPLGGNMTGDSMASKIVLLIRGDLLRRYPRTIIYAAEAKWVQAKDKDDKPIFDSQNKPVMIREPKELLLQPDPSKIGFPEKYPIFQGTLSPDMTFLGFDLDPAIANGNQDPAENKPGWFFVLQQPPTEARYGLDETEPDTLTETWRDLSWKSAKKSQDQEYGYIQLGPLHDPKDKDKSYLSPTKEPDKNIIWGTNSAAMAYITLQGPFRVAIHASDLLPQMN